MGAPTTARSPRIDVMRGLSILAVLVLHFSATYRLRESVFATLLTPALLRRLVINGNYGVTIFFVVSGFLITSTSLDRFGALDRLSPRRFYAFRAARILPCLAVALAIVVGLGLAGVPSFDDVKDGAPMPRSSLAVMALSVLTFWHNVLMSRWGYFNYAANIYWSLSVEEVFYLVFPIACLVLRRERLLLALWSAAIVAGPVYRSFHVDDEIFYMYGYLGCFDAIAIGCATAVVARRVRPGAAWRAALGVVGWAIVGVTYLRGIPDHEVFGFTTIALGAALLLLGDRAPETDAAAPTGWRRAHAYALAPLRWLGRHSYELYLFHIIVLGAMRELVPGKELAPAHKPAWMLLYLALSCAVAGAIARWYAEPSNRRLRAMLAP